MTYRHITHRSITRRLLTHHAVTRHLMAAVALLVLGTGAAVRAAVVLPGDLAELAHQARAIVHGRVVAVEARRIGDARRIDSLVTFEPHAYLKGDLGATVRFRVPGGRVGRYRSLVVGAPELAPGDEVVVFLSGRPPALPNVLGMSQGLFRVVRDAAGRALVSPPVLLSPTASGPGAATRVVRGDPARRLATVDEFAARVAEALAAPPPAPRGAGR